MRQPLRRIDLLLNTGATVRCAITSFSPIFVIHGLNEFGVCRRLSRCEKSYRLVKFDRPILKAILCQTDFFNDEMLK